MAADRKTPGESITSRLASRSARAPLQRRSMPGGGEVWEGPLASKALKALGARAMTVDSSIIVGDDFDAWYESVRGSSYRWEWFTAWF